MTQHCAIITGVSDEQTQADVPRSLTTPLASDGVGSAPASVDERRQLVLAAAAVLVAAQTGFRAWALYPSFFFTDDYRLMLAARATDLSVAHLLTPFDSQFMPAGRLAVWLVAYSGATNWSAAATLTLLVQLLASAGCVWMLATLFGARPAILGPLVLYLTSALTMPGFMWWAAALNQLPMQLAFFLAVGSWVEYLRTRRRSRLLATFAALTLGLACYPKALLIVPVLAWLLLAYFTQGTLRERLRSGLTGFPLASVLGATAAVGYLAFYLVAIPQPFESESPAAGNRAAEVADAMLGTSLPTGLLGGPWTWLNTSPPIVLAQPPSWTVPLAWTILVLGAVYLALRRARTGRAWVLLGGYALLAYALLATSRGQLFGRIAGLEYRYLTDVLPVAALAIGLACLGLRGAVGSSAGRPEPLIDIDLGPRTAVAATVLVALGGTASSLSYVQYWHEENAGRGYVKTVQAQFEANGPVDLADQLVPSTVMPEYTKPSNRTAVFIPLVSDGARFPLISSNLKVLDDLGQVVPAVITPGPRSLDGPDRGCGYRLTAGPTRIRLDSAAFDFGWWVRIGYLAGSDGTLSARIGDVTQEVPVIRGLNSAFVHVTAEFDSVELSSTAGGGVVCVDSVEVGQAVPGVVP